MQRHPQYTRKRLTLLAERIRERIYADIRPVTDLQVAGPTDRIPYVESKALSYSPARPGQMFGPMWSTFWFRGRVRVPAEWAERRVDLLWVSHSEATLWVKDRSVQGLNHDPTSWDRSTRPDAPLLTRAAGGEDLEFVVEMACNGSFGYADGLPSAPVDARRFVLDRCDIAAFDPEAWTLFHDFSTLVALEAEGDRGLDPSWAGELLFELNRFANLFNPDDRATWPEASAILHALYQRKNATATHELSAIGHAHIDTAWLWPLAETHRKCERTFSTQTAYMRQYPEYKFACSQAYQYEVIRQRNPDLYKRIKTAHAAGQWIPVGGTWIEPDCNIPSGESLIRQFLFGQRFFEKEFGRRCREFWNPDVFGYNGQLPQIMRLAGITRFLTQKLSWNRFTKPPCHTFRWQGIDGSEVLAHFPPADTYNAQATVRELRHNVQNYKDHDRSRHSLMLFGFGDGGGGPTRTMLESLRRARDLQGLPRTTIDTPDEFFEKLEADNKDPLVIVGELYFEMHRGTYTTQAKIKQNNRRCEQLLHDIEFIAASAARLGKVAYPREELERIWKILLLNQFHDILPGSSIGEVYVDAASQFEEVITAGEQLRERMLQALCGAGAGKRSHGGEFWLNTTAFPRDEVFAMPDNTLSMVRAQGFGFGAGDSSEDTVAVRKAANEIILENRHLAIVVKRDGTFASVIEKSTGRETLAAPGNELRLYDDHPVEHDAWDVDPFHLETASACDWVKTMEVTLQSPLRAELTLTGTIGQSSKLTQTIRLDAESRRIEVHCDVDWQENRKMLKVAFPLNVRAMHATYEMQFGNTERPTHFNTLADLAKFEVPGHRWADLSEHGFGAAVLTDCKYGYAAHDNTLTISLLRSPFYPDPTADRGRHTFKYALLPHVGGWREGRVVAEAAHFNAPLLPCRGNALTGEPLLLVEDPNIVIDTIKFAEDSDALVVRLYECHGARGSTRLITNLPAKEWSPCNALEDPAGPFTSIHGSFIELNYRPYEIISLLIR